MNEVCCSSGKARVYYNIPTQGGLKYKLKNSTKWITILRNEPLTHSCSPGTEKDAQYFVTCGIDGFDCNPWCVGPISWIGNNAIQTGNGISYFQGRLVGRNCDGNLTIERQSPGKDPFIFTVTGTETGTKYLEIEVDECPDVQTIPCKFDPAKERFIDVEMIPYFPLPIPLPSYPINQDCIEITSVGNFVVIQKVTTRNYGPKGDNDPSVRRTEKIIKTVESPKGCPAPKVRVECCPNGICGENKRCPKGTDCESICNGFKCCYKNGKLIRSIKI
jgi:hypothetical protein